MYPERLCHTFRKTFLLPNTSITRSSYLVIIRTIRMKHPRKIFCSLLFLWKETQTFVISGKTHICICIYMSTYLYLFLCLFALRLCLFRDSSPCRVRGCSVDTESVDAIRKKTKPLDGRVGHCHRPDKQTLPRRFHN